MKEHRLLRFAFSEGPPAPEPEEASFQKKEEVQTGQTGASSFLEKKSQRAEVRKVQEKADRQKDEIRIASIKNLMENATNPPASEHVSHVEPALEENAEDTNPLEALQNRMLTALRTYDARVMRGAYGRSVPSPSISLSTNADGSIQLSSPNRMYGQELLGTRYNSMTNQTEAQYASVDELQAAISRIDAVNTTMESAQRLSQNELATELGRLFGIPAADFRRNIAVGYREGPLPRINIRISNDSSLNPYGVTRLRLLTPLSRTYGAIDGDFTNVSSIETAIRALRTHNDATPPRR